MKVKEKIINELDLFKENELSEDQTRHIRCDIG